MLSDIPLLPTYRSDERDLMHEFYVPCLGTSNHYRRAVGFFSSSVLAAAAKGLHAFLQGGGHMELIASPLLSPEDIKAIQMGYDRRQIEEKALADSLSAEFDRITAARLGLLAWLISQDRLDIKIAVVTQGARGGLYHEKIGLFSDGRDFVAFTGSPNESVAGMVDNFECIDVYCSWKPEDRTRALEKRLHLDRLWSNTTPRLQIVPFPEAARRSLLRLMPARMPKTDPEDQEECVADEVLGTPRLPESIILRPYQNDAADNWFKANGRGILKMATGSGKTITSLAIVERLHREIGLKSVVIVVPYRHLVAQWAGECQRFGLNPIRCSESRQGWYDVLQQALVSMNSPGATGFTTVVVTNATLRSDGFQNLLSHFPDRTVLIGDEAHNLGAHNLVSSLPRNIGLRLGLSATPERWFDEIGTQALVDYFGPVLQPEFTLSDALKAGALVPYSYHPILVKLTDTETDQYVELSRRIAKTIAGSDSGDVMSDALKALLIRRARLIGGARNKLNALRDIVAGRRDISHALFYCGDGTVEGDVGPELRKHVQVVCMLLGKELGVTVDSYIADTPLEERLQLRDAFISGDIQGLVAIRCLDEGVDIPAIRSAFILASSTNPRQFIQRRGRVLRPYPGKDSAEIFDFLVVPPRMSIDTFEIERNLLARELSRYIEFAGLALNAGQITGLLTDLQARYGLLGIASGDDRRVSL